ncbi:BspA type Leucine rich repeat region (6 copies) [Popillia japonica]|uniref:BspA type Leucine rich repeat region (6 copies) n=1 Tax=Popillia japonica TaxID=7064 RepID=A0AAW1L625_POPJA
MFCKVLIVSAVISIVCCCKSIRNVEVNGVLTNGKSFTTVLNGCIDRKSILIGNDSRKISEIDINQQDIPRLEKDSIKHLIYLRRITIRNTNLEVLDLDIFRNTPKLETVDFISNKIQIIRDGVYNYQDFISVSLYNNQILTMDDMAFANMSQLTSLNISYNQLDVFVRGWFYNLPKLTTIDFQHNQIETLRQKAFANIPSVKNIYLNNNNIQTIEPHAFKNLGSLVHLDLRHNLLQTLNSNSFPKKISVTGLYLNANRINALKKSLWTAISVSNVSLDGNPWNCYCMRDMEKLLEKQNINVVLSPECSDTSIPVCAAANLNECIEEHSEELTNFYYKQLVHQKDSPCVRYME